MPAWLQGIPTEEYRIYVQLSEELFTLAEVYSLSHCEKYTLKKAFKHSKNISAEIVENHVVHMPGQVWHCEFYLPEAERRAGA